MGRMIFSERRMRVLWLLLLLCLAFLENAQAQVNMDNMSDADAHYYIDKWRVTHAELMQFDKTTLVKMNIGNDAEGVTSVFIETKQPKDADEAPGKINGIPVSQGILDKMDPKDIDILAVTNEGKLNITTKSGKITLLTDKANS